MDHAINKYVTGQEITVLEKDRFSHKKKLKIVIILNLKHYNPVIKVVCLKQLCYTFLYFLRNDYFRLVSHLHS